MSTPTASLYGTPTPPRFALGAEDFIAVGSSLQAAGYTHPVFTKTEAIITAMDRAIREDAYFLDKSMDIITMSPEQVADHLRQAVINRANYQIARTVFGGFSASLAASAGRELAETSDEIVASLAKDFDASLIVVKRAAAQGITSTTTAADILSDGGAKTVTAWKELPAAVNALDRIAALRMQLNGIGVGPSEPDVACLVAASSIGNADDLKRAQFTYKGEYRWSAELTGPSSHPTLAQATVRRPVPRVGGSWLALVNDGFTPRINTHDQAYAVLVAAAQPSGDAA